MSRTLDIRPGTAENLTIAANNPAIMRSLFPPLLLLLSMLRPIQAAPASLSPDDQRLCDQLATRCTQLLESSVIDFYLPNCVDTNQGGYFETLQDGKFAPSREKFLTLQSRQCWFFSTLVAEGIRPETTFPAARHGYEFLQRSFLDPVDGGYYSKVSQAGEATDRRKHAYLNSFALYALAAYYRASADLNALQAAQHLFQTLDQRAHDPTHGGYREFFYASWTEVTNRQETGYVGAIGIKTYNTHLHLLESFAELYRIWPDPLLGQRIAELIQINSSTVHNPEYHCNLDGWHPDWQVLNTPQNLRTSYGHDIECAWLTLDAARALGLSPELFRSWAEALCATSVQFGYDHEHGGFYYTGPLGQPANDLRKEWWVQAEALVSMLEMLRLTGQRTYLDLFKQTLEFVERHQISPEGGWLATCEADGSPRGTVRTSPWQGAYHNGRALLRSSQLLAQLAQDK